MEKQVQVQVPTKFGVFELMAYSESAEERMPHLVLVNPETDFSTTVNVRVHSECMTGDVFSSYRCECGEQLDRSLEYINEHGGILIYLRQEGRGIGLINKMHAYIKQDQGYDTADANKILGFGYDERTYEDAVSILENLEIDTINLITNNPDKISSLEQSGIQVESRITLDIKARQENLQYLKTKKEKFGHKLDF
ncbi:MAG: GTP cyclohydrolase II [Saprospiraceae bacterium]|nr:GTP cyclohydrolase II [Saprospiraceae bacterium]